MFDPLQPLIPDPILGLSAAYHNDPRDFKVDLGVGVYKDENGHTPILDCVNTASQIMFSTEDTKAYQSPAGDVEYNQLLKTLIFGESIAASGLAETVHTPGGSGALKLAAQLVKRASATSKIWVSTPTWANHIPLLGSSGVELVEYAYFDPKTNAVDFDAMMSDLKKASSGDVVLLHGCCHNPTGADLSQDQWREVAELVSANGLIPFVDVAYHGFGDGLDEDISAVRLLCEAVPELIVAYSCSKNFGVYRDRVGAVSVVVENPKKASITSAHLQNIGREIYSMPPSHGAGLIRCILQDEQLTQQWHGELESMRTRISQLRLDLSSALEGVADFSFIARQKGMFSFLGLTEAQVDRLRDEFAIYMTGNSRINIAGINQKNLAHLTQAIAAVL